VRTFGGTDTVTIHALTAPAVAKVTLDLWDAGGTPEQVVVSPTPTGHAMARFDEAIRLASLTVNSGGRANLTPGGNKLLALNSLAINGTGRFDLADNSAIIDYTGSSPIATIQQRLASGYNGGAWNGLGIISSTAASRSDTGIGYAEATDLFSAFPATFRGQSIDGTSILLTHTLYGDADLNRTVNLDDFNRLATNFGASGRRWAHGDSTYDQTVNLNDFNALAANFGRAAAAAAEAGGEPHAVSGGSPKRVADDVLER
jgi:hypothetical protein